MRPPAFALGSRTPSAPRRIALVCLVGLTGCAGGPEEPHSAAPGDASPDGIERALAEVNGVPILARQVERIREADRLRLSAEGRSAAELEFDDLEIRRQGLQLAINAELCFQAAKAEGLTVSDEDIGEQIEALRSQFATEEEFDDYLKEAGLDLDRLSERAARRMLVESYARSITGELVLDEAAAEALYREQKDRFRQSEQIRAAQIIVRALPHDSQDRREAARRKIDEAFRRLESGEEFATVAEAYSESPFASRGGDLGFIPRGRALPEFDTVVFETPVGTTTPVFETPHGYNIVKVLDRREGTVSDFAEVKTSLMMVLAREQKDTTLREHIEELRAAATIRVLDPELRPDAVE